MTAKKPSTTKATPAKPATRTTAKACAEVPQGTYAHPRTVQASMTAKGGFPLATSSERSRVILSSQPPPGLGRQSLRHMGLYSRWVSSRCRLRSHCTVRIGTTTEIMTHPSHTSRALAVA